MFRPHRAGIPQIEVTFDLDVNGILSISAKDKATGQEQSIRIEGNGGLSDSDIEDMVQDAAASVEDDRQRLEEVESRNKLDSLIYQTNKMLDENKDSLSPETVSAVTTALESGKEALDSGENMTVAFEELQSKLHALSSELYQSADQTDQSEESPSDQEDVIDAEFEEEVKD